MLTFSEICDNFVKAEGFSKVECASDPEAKQYAARMGYDSARYPVVYFKSDTTGEKAYEEFFVPGEKIAMDRFSALGVVEKASIARWWRLTDFSMSWRGYSPNQTSPKARSWTP